MTPLPLALPPAGSNGFPLASGLHSTGIHTIDTLKTSDVLQGFKRCFTGTFTYTYSPHYSE